MLKKVVALVTGGYSGESVISYKSAQTILANIDTEKFDCFLIDITRLGWQHQSADGKQYPVDRNDFSLQIDGAKILFDAVLIAIHGTPGEDGKLQGYFDMLGIPYTSCLASTSAITFNKRYTVAVAAMAGIPVAKSMHFYKGDSIDSKAIVNQLTFPLFVKPANGGSSIGMSKVPDAEGLEAAIEKAFVEDEQVLVEEFIAGREFTIGVCRIKGEIVVLPMTEVASENYFFDFEAKYEGKSRETTPAVVNESIAAKLREAARKVYQVFDCRGVVRIDFIYHEESGLPHMLEVNTVPGQSAASIIPQQVKVMGWTLRDFYAALIDECLK